MATRKQNPEFAHPNPEIGSMSSGGASSMASHGGCHTCNPQKLPSSPPYRSNHAAWAPWHCRSPIRRRCSTAWPDRDQRATPDSTSIRGFRARDAQMQMQGKIKRELASAGLDAGGDGEGEGIPWGLLEYKAYVADCQNDTTAVTYSRCGREIQVTFFPTLPPRVSYLCVFCRPAATDGEDAEMIPMEPQVLATDENLVLLRIVVSPEKDRDITYGNDLYVYQPAGDDEPSLTRLQRPPGGIYFGSYQVGILSCPTNRCDDHNQEKFYMVAALCVDKFELGRGRFVLYLYNSKINTWTVSNVSVEDEHFQKYQEEGWFLYQITRVIAVGGEDATVAFVDLWRGILLCDLSRLWWKNSACPTCCRDECVEDGWKATVWTRPVSACSLVDDSWERVCDMESSKMDVKSCPDFQLLPKFNDYEGRPLSPFKRLHVSLPTLICHTDDTVCFMVKINRGDAKAWVVVNHGRPKPWRGASTLSTTPDLAAPPFSFDLPICEMPKQGYQRVFPKTTPTFSFAEWISSVHTPCWRPPIGTFHGLAGFHRREEGKHAP
ncbi:hypothetical protein HU200_035747 [Digitaria exilis]|uniref:DUF1618 domain-containing protein n=1 Tax=Digitaria exilis TaxID=1010633 RepID=A0A835BIJ4_9POAL|nr:hypothetical protein HU200_035747 [Digitaria exilis]